MKKSLHQKIKGTQKCIAESIQLLDVPVNKYYNRSQRLSIFNEILLT
jgi:hypothetical protein